MNFGQEPYGEGCVGVEVGTVYIYEILNNTDKS